MARRKLLLLITFLASCTVSSIPVQTVIDLGNNFDNREILVHGHLCKDVTTIYLSTSSNCENFESGRRIILVVSKKQYLLLQDVENSTVISVQGKFAAPGPDGLVPAKGIVLGAHIDVTDINWN